MTISPAALAFAQRSQAIAWPWAAHAYREIDFVDAVVSLVSCFESTPIAQTQIDRIEISSVLLRVAYQVQRQLPAVPDTGPYPRHMSRRQRVRLALETLATIRRDGDARLGMVASLMDVTESHLSRSVSEETSLHFDCLLNTLRMVDVIVALRTTTLSMKEIAVAVGYRRTGAMDVIFGRLFHMAPSTFRGAVRSLQAGSADGAAAVRQFVHHHPNASPAMISDSAGVDFGVVVRALNDYQRSRA